MVKSARGLIILGLLYISLFNFDGANATVSKIPHTVSVLKLTRLVFPDITEDGTTKKSVPVRNLHENGSGELSGDMVATVASSMYVRNGTKRDLVMQIDVTHKDDSSGSWGGETLIALFRLAPKARLLDVANVRWDRESGLWDKPAILHGPSSDSLLVYYSHLNAGEEYFALELIEIVHDKLQRSEVNLPSIYNARISSAEIEELPSIEIPKQSGSGTIFRVAVKGKLIDESGGVKKSEFKTFQSKLIFSQGHWRCPSCNAMRKSIASMESRFGFSNE